MLRDEFKQWENYKSEIIHGSPGLVLATFMEHGFGKVWDYARGNHGTIYGARWSMRNGLNGLEFDGVDDWVDCGNDSSLDITDELTVEAWIKVKNFPPPGTSASIVSKYLAYRHCIEVFPDGRTSMTIYSSSTPYSTYPSTATLDADRWHFVTNTFSTNTGRMEIWLDGVLIKDRTDLAGIKIDTNSNNVKVGAHWQHFNGTIGEVRIYSRALDEAEIKHHYQLGKRWYQD